MFLSAMIKGMVFYDSGIKLDNASSKNAKLKPRSQFRVKHKNLDSLYKNFEFIGIATTNMRTVFIHNKRGLRRAAMAHLSQIIGLLLFERGSGGT